MSEYRDYVHQEYPRHLYGADADTISLVQNDEERDVALANGWTLEAPGSQPVTSDESSAAAVVEVVKKRGRGKADAA